MPDAKEVLNAAISTALRQSYKEGFKDGLDDAISLVNQRAPLYPAITHLDGRILPADEVEFNVKENIWYELVQLSKDIPEPPTKES